MKGKYRMIKFLTYFSEHSASNLNSGFSFSVDEIIFTGIVSLLVSLFITFIGIFLKYSWDKKGNISIYVKINKMFYMKDFVDWGFKSINGDKYQLELPLQIQITNDKNIDYVMRDICIYIYDDKNKFISKLSSVNASEKDKDIAIYGNNGFYSFIIDSKSIYCCQLIYIEHLENINSIDKLYIEYFDINDKKCKFFLKSLKEDICNNNLVYQFEDEFYKLEYQDLIL